MSDSDENFTHLRNRKVPRHISPPRNRRPKATSTPQHSPQISIDNIRQSIRETTDFLRNLSNQVDQNLSAPNLTSLFTNLELSINHLMDPQARTIYNKEMADLMSANIPKFELHSSANPALNLRSFIKACENVLSLLPQDNNEANEEFFKLIKFRLGYDVLERITIDKFENIKDLETHLRSICHIKLNKGKLLNQIRHERQDVNEDVSHFVERLRKLIAQGRSEYTNDKEFEREAMHTLKNAVKNELISIKLMDSNTDKFEELAEIAINRDSELHQRSYNVSKGESKASQEIIKELMQRIKDLESNKTANIQHIRQVPTFRTTSPNNYNTRFRQTSQSNSYCNYCKRPGHSINECRSKMRNTILPNSYNNFQQPRNYSRQNYTQNPNFQPDNFSRNNSTRPFANYRPQYNNSQHYTTRHNSPTRPTQHNPNHFIPRNNSPVPRDFNHKINTNTPITCLRCNKDGHRSNNCFEIICSICKQLGHSHSQCRQNTATRRVHFINCETCEESAPCNHQLPINDVQLQGNE